MDWVKEFYSCQNDWFGVYLTGINQSHQDRVELINSAINQPDSKVLELGAGGGQTAVALAKQGYQVTMIELLQRSVQHAHKLNDIHQQSVKIIQGDFYQYSTSDQFDIVCYFDSFGIGSDADQVRLLQQIETWLKPKGVALIEIGAPWFWSGVANGKLTDLGACMRHYQYDSTQQRLLDYWWLKEAPEQKVYQSLRCYSLDELKQLLKGLSLRIKRCISGGKIDFEEMSFVQKVPLKESMTYYVLLQKA